MRFDKGDFKKKEYNNKRNLILDQDLQKDSKSNKIIMRGIEGKNPKYAKHIMKKNELVMRFAEKAYGGIQVLEQPVCRSCEGIATWDFPDSKGNERGYCSGCHVHTTNPVTVHDYLVNEMKVFTEEEVEYLNALSKEQDEDNDFL